MSDLPFTNQRPFPRAPLIGAAMLIGMTIALAGISRVTGLGHEAPSASVVAELDLSFQDRADGGVDVIDARTHRLVDTVAPGTNGFLRATVRGLAQQRKRADAGTTAPFHLTSWSDGRLTLTDPAIDRGVELEAFGETNEAAFAKLLIDGTTHR